MVTKYIGWLAGDSDYVCDGTDDHVQINQALAWAAANPGNTVHIRGPYTYDIAASVLAGSSTVWKGDSTAKLKLNSSCMWATGVPVIGQIGGAGSHITGLEIYGFEIDCNESNLYDSASGRIWGKGYYNAIYIAGSSGVFNSDIYIHDMNIHDSLGDAVRIYFGSNVKVSDIVAKNMQHATIFFVEVVGGEIWNNDIEHITNAGVRLDNCQNVNIHDNDLTDFAGTSTAPKGGAHGVQIGNQPAGYGHTRLTSNINIYNNDITAGAAGILLQDMLGTAGTTAQTVHIYNNLIDGCAWQNWDVYFSGIGIYAWGNGLNIEYNTISDSHHAGILGYGAIASGVTASISNNNVTGTVVQTGRANSGYGITNLVPSKMSFVATNNYLINNVSGNYYNVTPVSESTSFITTTLPGDSTTDDDVVDPETGLDLPATRIYQQDLERDYYISGRTGYIEGKPFSWANKKVSVSKSNGQDKPPGTTGYALTDFGMEGSELTLDCMTLTIREMQEAIAAFTQPGRVTVELGGDFAGWQARGLGVDYSTDLKLNTVIPRNYHPYSLLMVMDQPYYESTIERIRSRYIYNSMQFTSDDCYAGNLVKNSSFEAWSIDTSLLWDTQTSAADVEYRCVRYAPELRQFCAVAQTGTNTRIAISDGATWSIPTGLTDAANRDNDWRGLAWGSSIGLDGTDLLPGRWVATSVSGTNNRAITSDNGNAWVARTTPADNSWGSCIYVRDDEEGIYRYVAVAYSGTDRVMYTDNGAVSWTNVSSADDANNWTSSDYSPELKRIVSVAYSGTSGYRAQYSDDYGATWTISATPAGEGNNKWTDVKWVSFLGLWVACSEDGTHQIMTSPTGLTGTWTLVDTPYASSTVTPGGGDIETTEYTSEEDYPDNVFSSAATAYSSSSTSLELTKVLPALTDGHIYRIDQVSCQLRTLLAGKIAYLKVTVQLGSSAESDIIEWTNNTSSYVQKTYDCAIESATAETVTLRYYMKTSDAAYRSAAKVLGVTYTEASTSGGSVTYTYNQWRGLAQTPELGLIVAVAQTGTGNGVMYSTDAVNWILGETAEDNAWTSVCYASYFNMFAAVGSSGTGNRVMISNSYGTTALAPNNWTYIYSGQSRSSATAIDGLYSLQITGDGITADLGTIQQGIVFQAGTRYILSAHGKAEGLTTGSLRVDIYSGNSVIKELIWDADTDWTQKQISFKFDVAPSDSYIRVRGYNLNMGAVVNCDKVLVERASDFELATTGADIASWGTIDSTPDVIVTGIVSSPDGSTAGPSTLYATPESFAYSSAATAYSSASTSLELTVILPALTGGGAYRIDQLSCQLKSATAISGVVAWLKVTIQLASRNNGNEYPIAEWGAAGTTYIQKSRDLALLAAAGESVTLRYYMMTTNAAYRAYAIKLGYVFTEMGTGGAVTTENLYLYNTDDTSKVLACCNILYPKYQIEINSDGTGSLSYAEDFQDDNCIYTAYELDAATYNETDKTLNMVPGSHITFECDCKYPVAGVPYIDMFSITGNPQIWIAEDVAGVPGTYYEIDGNTSSAITNASVYRLLDNDDHLHLVNKTKFYVKIVPYYTDDCVISSMYIYAPLSTVDAERFNIYKGGQANTIAAVVDDRSSCIVTLRYHDLDPAV